MNMLENYGREEVIVNMLKRLGFKQHLNGFDYWVYAISIACDDSNLLRSMIKGLYTSVAERFGTTPARVERVLRHSIYTALDEPAAYSMQYAVFGDDLAISNSRFAATITRMIKSEPHHRIFEV